MTSIDLQAVIACYRDTLYPLAWRLTRNDADAHDLVQETLVKALLRQDQLRSTDSILAWLRMILRRCFLNWYKRRRTGIPGRTESLPYLDEVQNALDEQACPSRIVLNQTDIVLIRETINALPDNYRDCVILSDLEGCTYAEIAARLDLPLITVKSRLHRGRVQARKALYKQGFE